MTVNPHQLYWDSSYEIALRLMEVYPDVNVEDVGEDQLYQWIIALPDFVDDPALVNEGILKAVLREWYEEADTR